MISLIVIFTILSTHWIADFIMQDEKWALNKSKNNKDLISHTLTYSSMWLIPMFSIYYFVEDFSFAGAILLSVYFSTITMLFHTATDYITSRIVSKKFANKQLGSSIPNLGAFTTIGFDQLLHYVQLFLTYAMLVR